MVSDAMFYDPAKQVDNDVPPNVQYARSESYTWVVRVQRNTQIIKDNLDFLYYKNKETEFKIYLVCYEKKLENQCRATAFISTNHDDRHLVLTKRHNHLVRAFNGEIPLLRQELTTRCLEKSIRSYTPRGIYLESIVNYPNGALDYTFVQALEIMRRMRRSSFPPTPRNLSHLHALMMQDGNSQFSNTLQNPPKRFYQGPLMVNGNIEGVLFCNTANIQQIMPELQNVCVAGCDGTFKVVPKFLENSAYQTFPLIHALLAGKTQEIYEALLLYIRNELPLVYNNVILMTDFELGLINAVKIVFPESQHQGCYFHFCQVNQYPEIAVQLQDFLLNYVWVYWFDTKGPSAITVYNQDIRTNNYIETYHASILKLIKPHPKVWEFLTQLLFLENQYYIEFKQTIQNLKIRNGVPTSEQVQNTAAVREFIEELAQDINPDRIVTFLRRAGHRVDGYISQEIYNCI
ncbi:Uncharacterized protein FWK35_00025138 [Aphis craccivora]|uniref:MULE transposase domain-containing protein n=1 Tax=Aphis craccivora TaxID=307492 RepID=A0A6G0Y6V4_APHCR|nr:Uncharacterized protein FWK35_00025138 [Aphis craccivora]